MKCESYDNQNKTRPENHHVVHDIGRVGCDSYFLARGK